MSNVVPDAIRTIALVMRWRMEFLPNVDATLIGDL